MGGCPLRWLTKNKGEKKKMTPNDIATDISGLKPAEGSDLTSMTTGTQSYVGGTWTIDDWNNWG